MTMQSDNKGQSGQDLGRTELDDGCDSDRNRPCMDIHLVTRTRHFIRAICSFRSASLRSVSNIQTARTATALSRA